jgi:hypothetical protein
MIVEIRIVKRADRTGQPLAETIEVRILASAKDAGSTFDLRCELREKLIDVLQRDHPQALPRHRKEAVGEPDSGKRRQATKASRKAPGNTSRTRSMR